MAARDQELQKPALGLLGAFALKAFGLNPVAFGSTVLPTVDVYDQYLAISEQKELSAGVTSTGIGASFLQDVYTVPNGKCWRLLACSGSVQLAAADVALLVGTGCAISPPTAPPLSVNLLVQYPPQMGTGIRAFGFLLPRPLVLPPGWQVLVNSFLSGVTTAAGTKGSAILVHEFDA